MARNNPTNPTMTMTERPSFYPVLPKHTRDVNDARYREEVATAVEHLKMVRKHQKELSIYSNAGSLSGLLHASEEETRKLILNDPAYRDAAAILYTGMAQSSGN
jgi:hypothetical protein